MTKRNWLRWGIAVVAGVGLLGGSMTTASADHGGHYGHGSSHYGHNHNAYRPNCAPISSYRPIVVPGYSYGMNYGGVYPGYSSYSSYSSYRPIVPGYSVVPNLGGYGMGGYGVGGYPPGASWGGGGRGFSLYIGR